MGISTSRATEQSTVTPKAGAGYDFKKIYANGIPSESSYKFEELGLGRAMLITPHIFKDERGCFIENFNTAQFQEYFGFSVAQDCMSVNKLHTLRGIHGDWRTWKVVNVPKGSVLACIIDLNPESPTYFQSKFVELNDKNRQILLVPPGFGNSFLVLEEGTIYCYKKSTYFQPGGEFTLFYNFVEWPADIDFILSKRDDARWDPDIPRCKESFEKAMQSRSDLENNPFLSSSASKELPHHCQTISRKTSGYIGG